MHMLESEILQRTESYPAEFLLQNTTQYAYFNRRQ
jgi:hypothetical protein